MVKGLDTKPAQEQQVFLNHRDLKLGLLNQGHINLDKWFAQDVMVRKFYPPKNGREKDFQTPRPQDVRFVIKQDTFQIQIKPGPRSSNQEKKSVQGAMEKFHLPHKNGQLKAFTDSKIQNASSVMRQGTLITMIRLQINYKNSTKFRNRLF